MHYYHYVRSLMNYKNVFLLALLLPIFVTAAKNKQTTSHEEVVTAQAIDEDDSEKKSYHDIWTTNTSTSPTNEKAIAKAMVTAAGITVGIVLNGGVDTVKAIIKWTQGDTDKEKNERNIQKLRLNLSTCLLEHTSEDSTDTSAVGIVGVPSECEGHLNALKAMETAM